LVLENAALKSRSSEVKVVRGMLAALAFALCSEQAEALQSRIKPLETKDVFDLVSNYKNIAVTRAGG
jgi:hypothetical protein